MQGLRTRFQKNFCDRVVRTVVQRVVQYVYHKSVYHRALHYGGLFLLSRTLGGAIEVVKLNKKNIAIVGGLLVVAPIILSQLIRLPFGFLTIGDENSWVGFFGGYIGAITGAVVAFIVARYQITTQFQKQVANEEMISFMNQKPALLKIKYDLIAMEDSLKELGRISSGETATEFRFEMYEMSQVFWTDIDRVEDTDLSISLIMISNSYKSLYKNFSTDLGYLDSVKEQLLIDILEKTPEDYEKMHRALTMAEQIERMTEEREQMIRNGSITKTKEDINNILEIIDIVITSIDEEKEKRQNIRDSTP